MQEKQAPLSFSALKDQFFLWALTAAAVYLCAQMKEMSVSISSLNEKVAVVITQLTNAEKRLDRQDERLGLLEGRVTDCRCGGSK